jgi:hypothetical protein
MCPASGSEGGERRPAMRGRGQADHLAAGNLFISDTNGNRIPEITSERNITTIAGTGDPTFSGDGHVIEPLLIREETLWSVARLKQEWP